MQGNIQRYAIILTLLFPAVVSHRTRAQQWSGPQVLNSTALIDDTVDWHARINSDGTGTWIVVWEGRRTLTDVTGINGERDILFSRSLDNGMTWTDPQTLNHLALDDCCIDEYPDIATNGTGTWICAWDTTTNVEAGGISTTGRDIAFSRSADSGQTWSDAMWLDSNAQVLPGNDFDVRISAVTTTTWIAVWKSNADIDGMLDNEGDLLFVRSIDDGLTWSDTAPLNTNAAIDSVSDVHPSIATDGAGTVIVTWDTIEGVYFSRSNDAGMNWSAPAAIDGSNMIIEQRSAVATDGAGVWIAIWESEQFAAIGPDYNSDIVISRSTDNGLTWSPPSLLHPYFDTISTSAFSLEISTDGVHWLVTWVTADPLGDTIGSDSDILFSRSDDAGATWTFPAPLNANAIDDNSEPFNDDWAPSIASDGAGHWVAVFESGNTLNGTLGEDTDVFVARSVLGGPDDCNINGIPDIDELVGNDCDGNGVLDVCDLNPLDPDNDGMVATDCDDNGVIDECDVDPADPDGDGDVAPDCNGNDLPDGCDVDPTDPDGNGETSADCNSNTISDECEADCNENGVPDACDVDPGDPDGNALVSPDCNADGIPDECQVANWLQSDRLVASDGQSHDSFGASVGVSDNVIAVAATGVDDVAENAGAVYVFRKVGGTWQEEAKLVPSIVDANARFGRPLDIDSDRIVIGTTKRRAYVFHYDGTNWIEEDNFFVNSPCFGQKVAIHGDRIVVGDYCSSIGGTNAGAVYVYNRAGGDWSLETVITAAIPTNDERLGYSVDVWNSQIGAGALDSSFTLGSAYMFRFDGSSWVEEGHVSPSMAGDEERFGEDVEIFADRAVISTSHVERVYTFSFDGSNWSEEQTLTSADNVDGDSFGQGIQALALLGNQLLVAADFDDHNGKTNAGSVYFFTYNALAWSQQARLMADDSAASDFFGDSVASDSRRAAIGASGVDGDGDFTGAVYVFEYGRDCNANGVLDECDVDPADPDGDTIVSPDCNGNGAPDACELDPADPDNDGIVLADCNANAIPDVCDLDPADPDGNMMTSADCNQNGVPDECEPDLDLDGIIDDCDICPFIADPDQLDCDTDGDGMGDACDDDIDGDGVLNEDDACPETPNCENLASGRPRLDLNNDCQVNGLDIHDIVQQLLDGCSTCD